MNKLFDQHLYVDQYDDESGGDTNAAETGRLVHSEFFNINTLILNYSHYDLQKTVFLGRWS